MYTRAVDMRKSFDGLCGIVTNYIHIPPENGNVFVFINRPRTRMKLLWWDRHGFWLLYKRLEEGCFQLPDIGGTDEGGCWLLYEQLLLMIEGIDLTSIKRRKRYIS